MMIQLMFLKEEKKLLAGTKDWLLERVEESLRLE